MNDGNPLVPPGGGAGDATARLPAPPMRDARTPWVLSALVALIVASFATLDLQWKAFLEPDALGKMREFIAGFLPPETGAAFLARAGWAAFETLSMSALGTLIAAIAGLALAMPASAGAVSGSSGSSGSTHTATGIITIVRIATRAVLNVLRSIPELVWAALMVIAAGLGPLPGTLALAAHTTGVLGRLFADTLENVPPGPAGALRANGANAPAVLLYATLPLAMPQLVSYALYRWENNIRAAAVLGVVGAGGLGQMLHFHLSLFQMREAATVILAMLAIVALVDAISFASRRLMTR